MEKLTFAEPNALVQKIKLRVEAMAKARGFNKRDLEQAARMSHSSYHEMWDKGTLTIPRLERMAELLNVNVVELLQDEPVPAQVTIASEPPPQYGRKRYLEDRLSDLETEVRKLKEKLRTP